METYIIKRYAEVEWNERQAATQHQSSSADSDRPGLVQQAISRVLLTVASVTRRGRPETHHTTVAQPADAASTRP